MPITNDRELQQKLNNLPLGQRRLVAAQLAAQVLSLSENTRLKTALSVALKPQSSEQALNDAYRTAKSIAVETYTACGRDADWALQAEHFVAAACTAALAPYDEQSTRTNSAWKAAMQARMAQNCAMISGQAAGKESEAQRQYHLVSLQCDARETA